MRIISCIIISLLFLPGISYSQPDKATASVEEIGDLWVMRSLVVWWDEYKAMCWADSSADTAWVFMRSECCDSTMRADSLKMEQDGYGTNWFYDEWPRCCREPRLYDWTHRVPTLDGFMEFLKSRLSKKYYIIRL